MATLTLITRVDVCISSVWAQYRGFLQDRYSQSFGALFENKILSFPFPFFSLSSRSLFEALADMATLYRFFRRKSTSSADYQDPDQKSTDEDREQKPENGGEANELQASQEILRLQKELEEMDQSRQKSWDDGWEKGYKRGWDDRRRRISEEVRPEWRTDRRPGQSNGAAKPETNRSAITGKRRRRGVRSSSFWTGSLSSSIFDGPYSGIDSYFMWST